MNQSLYSSIKIDKSTRMRILKAGRSMIVDKGRFGLQNSGLNPTGPMDFVSAAQANYLVGNNDGCALLEFCLNGPVLSFSKPVVLALTGGDFTAKINGQTIPSYCSFPVNAGETISFLPGQHGLYGYIAISGGIDVPLVFKSRSTNIKAEIGGHQGRYLKDGDDISLFSVNKLPKTGLWFPTLPSDRNIAKIRVAPGPQTGLFSRAALDLFYQSTYTVSAQSDRMGLCLSGPSIKIDNGSDIISDGIPNGSIQIPGDGTPIVMMADHQTTGGYAKIGVVFSFDIPAIAQLRPGEKLCFCPVSVSESQKQYRLYAQWLKRQEAYIQGEINNYE